MGLLKRILFRLLPREVRENARRRPVKAALQYYFFQRILRINCDVPWPVHWTSVVACPQRIKRKSTDRPRPGGNMGQYIQAINGIEFGENVWIGPDVKIISANHDLCDYEKHIPCEPIHIGDNCWIGAGAVILPEVTLGNHVVVAAGAVVNQSFSDDCLVGGVPAKVIKKLEPYRGGSLPNGDSPEVE